MATPTTREAFKTYCLRRLGAPVLSMPLDDDQVEDRIDDALKYYWDYHFDGSEKQYYKAQVTQTDIDNKYFTLPQNIIGAVRVFPLGMALSSNNLFNIRYQIALNDLYDLTNVTMVPFYMAMQHIQFLEQLLVGEQPIRYNRNMNRLHIDTDWSKLNIGEYVVIEAYQIVDPTEFSDVWNDRWLLRYATALMKQQLGTNITRYSGAKLPGGYQFNGDKMYDDACKEIDKLEEEMIVSYSLPVSDMIG